MRLSKFLTVKMKSFMAKIFESSKDSKFKESIYVVNLQEGNMDLGDFQLEIRSKYRDLRPSEKKVADLIFKENKKIVDWNIGEFAEKAGISQPTVIRFSKAMGLKGYRALKDRILEEYAREDIKRVPEQVLDYPIRREDRLVDLPVKVIMTNIKHLEETLKALSTYEFLRAVRALEDAKNISVYAVENSTCTAEDFSTKMTYIGKQVYFNKDSYMQKVNAKNLSGKDVAVGISHTGRSKHTVEALKCAKEAGALTISITNSEQALINKYADVILCTENDQYMYGNAIFTRSVQVSLVDMLYLGVFLSNYDYYAEQMNRSWKNIQDMIY